MNREKVVIFDGEDKFIAPKSRTYNKKIGKSEFVGVVESPEGDKAPISTIDGDAFNDYMRRKNLPAVMPSPSEPDFCAKAQAFIQSNGDGKATPDQIMQVYQLFQDNCVEKPKEGKPVDSDSPPPAPPQEEEPVKAPPALGSMPTTSIPLGVSLTSPTLGKPPVKAGGASAGGGGEEKEEPKKGTNWLLWLLIGGTALYFVTRKK
jgi:hypothetical protein